MSGDLISTLLFFVPALLLGLSLLLGYRPGERLLIRWATRRTQRHRYAPLVRAGSATAGSGSTRAAVACSRAA